ncbi:hypothetical protein CSHISOI_05427 [Colletotrichum shisoi]|uniref:Uncharacterized protein n=1 Tax=Colletotrichum shisoi TaxID=2078593 RepID=A0A5Q4BTW0_9PEZI|nr:hypothetical protein CSHISOI_05427 [Colletotrichum shisoi]
MSGDPTVEDSKRRRISRKALWAGARVRGTQTLGDGKGRGHFCQPFPAPLDSPSVPAARGWQMGGTEAELRPNIELEPNMCVNISTPHMRLMDSEREMQASRWEPSSLHHGGVALISIRLGQWRIPPVSRRTGDGLPGARRAVCRFVSSIGFWRQSGLHPNRYDTMRDGFGPRVENSVEEAFGASHDCKPSAALGLRLVKGTWRHGARLSSIDARPGRFSRNRLPASDSGFRWPAGSRRPLLLAAACR